MDREELLQILSEELTVGLEVGPADDFSGMTSIRVRLMLNGVVISEDYERINIPA